MNQSMETREVKGRFLVTRNFLSVESDSVPGLVIMPLDATVPKGDEKYSLKRNATDFGHLLWNGNIPFCIGISNDISGRGELSDPEQFLQTALDLVLCGHPANLMEIHFSDIENNENNAGSGFSSVISTAGNDLDEYMILSGKMRAADPLQEVMWGYQWDRVCSRESSGEKHSMNGAESEHRGLRLCSLSRIFDECRHSVLTGKHDSVMMTPVAFEKLSRALDRTFWDEVIVSFLRECDFPLSLSDDHFELHPGNALSIDICRVMRDNDDSEAWRNMCDFFWNTNRKFLAALASLQILQHDPCDAASLDRALSFGGVEGLMAEKPFVGAPESLYQIPGNESATVSATATASVTASVTACDAACGTASMHPFFSVIMPTYNRGERARAAIESVLAQNENDFELLIINDGGDDRICELITLFSSHLSEKSACSPIRYVKIDHKGLSGVLNCGLSLSRGRYIAYLDDDDVWYPDHLAILKRELTERGFPEDHIVYTKSYRVHGAFVDDEFVELSRNEHDYLPFDREKTHTRNLLSVLNAAHHRNLSSRIGGFNEGLEIGMDWDFWARASFVCNFSQIDAWTGEYRIYGGNMTQSWKKWGLFHLSHFMVDWFRSGRGLTIILRASMAQNRENVRISASRRLKAMAGRRDLVVSASEMRKTLMEAAKYSFSILIETAICFGKYRFRRLVKALLGR
ncbi:MAG: hypothetical protein CVV64_12995 [Candidatus Wallbacteria bacterium HGW-Wallbacteria-1]|jgi:glycosyltransferase involved in cell wall biosynthesis|uniref:Glycosyltransferase 2-like domain-containing protein n=1 Tax=Candidatus Wallbacteria bacterium HGW-Wallbacteria-1 TaxID=2013854 RepID=A0A2N1PN02_9BACT|nr:MAG: hypothetical protein CVV64_12995 [Candidatus Wallbacteria bacterium HGW-Wallbacteria-1]